MKTEPNKAMEPSRVAVTDRAYARSAPSTRLAHLGRSAKKKMHPSAIQVLLIDTMEKIQPLALSLRQIGTSPQEIESRFLAWNKSTDLKVGAAIQALAEDYDMPKLTQQEATMLYFRLDQGSDILEVAINWDQWNHPEDYEDAKSYPDHERADWIHWLLVEMWSQSGFGAIHGIIEEFSRGNVRAEHDIGNN